LKTKSLSLLVALKALAVALPLSWLLLEPPLALSTTQVPLLLKRFAILLSGELIITYTHNKNASLFCLQTVKDIEALGTSAKSFQGDLSKVDGIRAVFAQIKDAYPQGLDIVVLNAAVSGPNHLGSTDEKFFDYIFDTNVKGVYFSAQESSKQIKEGGKLLFISSVVTHSAFPGLSVYAASKGAVDQFARLLAVELGHRKISVNAIAPAFTETDMLPEQYKEVAVSSSVFKRIGQAEDIANATAGVIQAPWITGAVIPVTGGAAIY
jgi:NAD(P)-dependent dehydrogenase (short-subunit alcohol dehydrogenase family)